MSKCSKDVDFRIKQLREIYDEKYLNGILLKDTLLKGEYVERIDRYISQRLGSDIYLYKMIFLGTINISDSELYNRTYSKNSLKRYKNGYMTFLKIEINYRTNYLIIFKLENGQKFQIEDTYNLRQVSEFTIDRYIENEEYYKISGSSHEIRYHNIEDYIKLFRSLQFLTTKYEDECPQFIELLDIFSTTLDMSFANYNEYLDKDTINLIMDIVSSNTFERGRISKFRRVNLESSKMSEYELKYIKSGNLKDRANLFADLVFSPAFLNNIENTLSLVYLDKYHIRENLIIVSKLLQKLKHNMDNRKDGAKFKDIMHGMSDYLSGQSKYEMGQDDDNFVKYLLHILEDIYKIPLGDMFKIEIFIIYFISELINWDYLDISIYTIITEPVNDHEISSFEYISTYIKDIIFIHDNIGMSPIHIFRNDKPYLDNIILLYIVLAQEYEKEKYGYSILIHIAEILDSLSKDINTNDIIMYISTELTNGLDERDLLRYIYYTKFQPIDPPKVQNLEDHYFNIKTKKILDRISEILDSEYDLEIYLDEILDMTEEYNFINNNLVKYRGTDMMNIIVKNLYMYIFPLIIIIYEKFGYGIEYLIKPENQKQKLIKYVVKNALKYFHHNIWLALDILLEMKGINVYTKYINSIIDLTIFMFHHSYTKSYMSDILKISEYDGSNKMIFHIELVPEFLVNLIRKSEEILKEHELEEVYGYIRILLTNNIIFTYMKYNNNEMKFINSRVNRY